MTARQRICENARLGCHCNCAPNAGFTGIFAVAIKQRLAQESRDV